LFGVLPSSAANLPSYTDYVVVAGALQWNAHVPKEERLHEDGRLDFLYLIRPLYEVMKDTFPRAWILPRDLTCDESLWSFKGRTFLKRFMKDKPKKYGFLEYAVRPLLPQWLFRDHHCAPPTG
jgi:hypothetical protein